MNLEYKLCDTIVSLKLEIVDIIRIRQIPKFQ